MKNKIIVFEEIYNYMHLIIKWYLINGLRIYYYRINGACKEKIWLKEYTKNNSILKIDEKYNILSSAVGFYSDLSYKNVNKIFDFLIGNNKIVKKLTELYEDDRVHNAFKKSLLGYLHRFYYINFILHKLNEIFLGQKIYFVQTLKKEEYRINILGIDEYLIFRDFVSKSGAFYYEHSNIMFPLWFILICKVNQILRLITAQITTIGFILWTISISLLNLLNIKKPVRKNYKFGITIIGPRWQFANRIQKVDFLIDNEKIKKNDVLFISLKRLPSHNRFYMKQNNLNFADDLLNNITLTNTKKTAPLALYLLFNSFKYRKTIFIIESALLQLISFIIWKGFKENYSIENLISHCDFGLQSIMRNIIVSKAGTKTWYYIDAINWNNFILTDSMQMNVPKYNHAIGFLLYDYLLSWSDDLIDYFKIHYQNIRNYINIGCLWSQHIREIQEGKIESSLKDILFKNGFRSNYKLISVFDSTYLDNTITTYEDGLNFLKDIYQLLEEIPNTFILFKEKKTRHFVQKYSLDMLFWLKKLESHPRCYLPLRDMNTSEAIAFSDLTISFPFTSTTFEALAAKRKALYHDASDKFRGTFYDKIPGLVCHNYNELLNRTKELLFETDKSKYDEYLDEFVKKKVEPYLDGNALTRFRELLTNQKPNYLK